MATITSLNLSTPGLLAKTLDTHRAKAPYCLNQPWKMGSQYRGGRIMHVRPVGAAPDKISEKVAESIKEAEEKCSDDPKSGECVAAWDEVEELSAEASHQRDKMKQADPLENYCKDNPETDECRTYDN